MNERDYQLIEDYLNGSLKASEKAEVEARLMQDNAFAKILAQQQDLLAVVDKKVEDDLRLLLAKEEAKLSNNVTNKVSSPTIPISRWLSVAAAVVVLITVGWLLFRNESSPNGSTLFAENFTAYTNIIAPNRRGENDESRLSLAFLAYDNKQYQKAIADFETLKSDTLKSELTFYIGVSYLAINEIEKGIITLKDDAIDSKFAMEKQWYLALAYLKKNDIDAAKIALNKALHLSTDPVLGRNVSELLDKVNSIE
ncbi:hypothetical protein OB69_07950 [Roseivirga seohaensis subsp. aquiponti]|uniref:Uncharacterized protein n=1 Tax=Roseivirga seohaensis subsp. aquiponti TaxID=1566026 RepID=A0A0L8AL86_9BACT|nr:hypothetical protein [Roseivirga seohaensis]KOF03228.1 hypothetical protein OB69_07950 [Roseivirga seohaensis subsp. aquiponti]